MLNDSQRLAIVLDRLKHMPIRGAASAEEPWVTFDLIEITKTIEIAEGKTDPMDWVSVPCKNITGDGSDDPYIFEHLAHWWSDYKEGRDPLRIPHWCQGLIGDPHYSYVGMDYKECRCHIGKDHDQWGTVYRERD